MPPRKNAAQSGKFGPVTKKTPWFDECQSVLAYDGMTVEEIKALTPQQKADKFFSQWMEKADPFTRYANYLGSGRETPAIVMGKAKRLYKNMVLKQGWEEIKFVMVLDHMFNSNIMFSNKVCEECGVLYDDEELPFQRTEKRLKRKRI